MHKKFGSILITLLIGISLIGCDSNKEENNKIETKNVATADIVKKVKESIEVRQTAVVPENLVIDRFYLNMDDVEEQTIEQGQINSGLETLAVVKAKEGKADSIKESFEKVKKEKEATAFYPGEPEAVEAAEIEVIGDYVGFFIIPNYEEGQDNTEKAIEIFKETLK